MNSSELPQATIDTFNLTARRVDKRSGAAQLSVLIEEYLEKHRQEAKAGKRMPQVGT
jgi:hypothetical protein